MGYAFDHLEQTLTATVNGTEQQEAITHPIPDKGIMQSAQFFVAWGALTLMYCIVALLVYMLVTANQELERAFDFLVATVSLSVTHHSMIGFHTEGGTLGFPPPPPPPAIVPG